jgi:hypothetical protein
MRRRIRTLYRPTAAGHDWDGSESPLGSEIPVWGRTCPCGSDTPFGFAQGRLCPTLLTLLAFDLIKDRPKTKVAPARIYPVSRPGAGHSFVTASATAMPSDTSTNRCMATIHGGR